jgi:hypothetical protein
MDYFACIIENLETKLTHNVQVHEKDNLNIYKWIWEGDVMDDEDDSQCGRRRKADKNEQTEGNASIYETVAATSGKVMITTAV